LETVNNNPTVNKGGAPRLYTSAQLMQERVDQYIKDVESRQTTYINEKTGMPTVRRTPLYYGRLLLYLGFASRQSAIPYQDGEYDDDVNKFSNVLARARALCGADIAEGAMMGDYKDKVSLAVLAHDHDVIQKTEVINTGSQSMITAEDAGRLMSGMAQALLQVAGIRQQLEPPTINITPDNGST
jgi:hypothetical protein